MSETEEKQHHHSHSSHHHRHHRHHRKHKEEGRNTQRMWWVRIGIGAAAIAVAVLLVRGAISRWENKRFAVPRSVRQNYTQTVETAPNTVFADGIRYDHRPNLEAFLFMGIDVPGTVESMTKTGNGGQADVQIVLVVDNDNKTWQALQLNRDALADVPVLGIGGKLIGYQRKQLALAHFYGSGREDSCENTVNAVTKLLWNQPINGYISLNMDGIGIVNDAIGGVEVTITTDFSGIDDSMELGSQVVLNGKQAVTFLRSRMGVDDGTNLARMSRHRQYLDALIQKLLNEDESSILKAYSSAEDYIVSNMSSGSISALAEKLQRYEQQPMLTVEGTPTVAGGANAYEMDKVSLQNTILTLLYQKREG